MKNEYKNPKTSLLNKFMYINNNIIFEKNNDDNYLCINKSTGLIYEISINLYNFMVEIHGIKIDDMFKEILYNIKHKPEDMIMVIKYIFSLLKQELILIVEENYD